MSKKKIMSVQIRDVAGEIFMVVARDGDKWKLSRHLSEIGKFNSTMATRISHALRAAYPGLNVETIKTN